MSEKNIKGEKKEKTAGLSENLLDKFLSRMKGCDDLDSKLEAYKGLLKSEFGSKSDD